MDILFEILRNTNLLTNDEKVNTPAIASLSTTQIVDITELLTNEMSSVTETTDRTAFVHSASLSLGGSREACMELGCRSSKVDQLARFALMYSDRVYINNFFADYSHIKDSFSGDIIKRTFFHDLIIAVLLRPLVEMGSIVFFTPPAHTCTQCWAEQSFGPDAGRRLMAEYKRLEKEYFSHTSVKLKKENNGYELTCEGPEPYYEHGSLATPLSNLPEPLSASKQIINRLGKGEEVTLSEGMRRKLAVHKQFVGQVMNNISYELTTSQILKTSFLTDKPMHISILNSLSSDMNIEKRNSIALKHLTSMVPFIDELEIKDLIKLRKREEEAFIQYRSALNEAIDEFRLNKSGFTENDARSLYSDVIAPRLSALEQRTQHAKRDLLSKGYRPLIAVTAAISFGLYTGFIPAEIAEIAKVIGFTKVAADILEKIMAFGDAEKTIKSDELYFLWKVKKLQK